MKLNADIVAYVSGQMLVLGIKQSRLPLMEVVETLTSFLPFSSDFTAGSKESEISHIARVFDSIARMATE